jgi:hypothetical protein
MPMPALLKARAFTAPVSHQKRPRQDTTSATNSERKRSKINETDPYPPAHNGLVAGSSPAGPTKQVSDLLILVFDHRTRNAPFLLRTPPCVSWQTSAAFAARLGPLLFNRSFGGRVVRNG